MSKLPISVCIIARNEEKHIENCLRRIKPYGFEIIVADTGSTDRTKEIAARYADRVLDYPWADDFSAVRNFCAAHASYKWILSVDCDEYMESCDTAELLRLTKRYPHLPGALEIRSVIARPDGSDGCVKDFVPRFYDKKRYCYDKPVHEQLVPCDTKDATGIRNFALPIEIIHHGYALPPEEMHVKQERNLRLLHRQLETEGESPYLYYQLGQSELVLEHYEEAARYYERGMACGADCGLLYVHGMIEGLAKAYVMTGRGQEALALMERYEPRCNSARYVFYHANVLMDNDEPLKALVKYVKATMMPDTDTLGDELLYCYQHIVELYRRFGEEELAEVFKKRYEELMADNLTLEAD
ncbi:MAG: glycosyltransferase family 2 protein [Roseburia sp.]|nr:glycosyltransferase family 2 protein [Roseburia sp.]